MPQACAIENAPLSKSYEVKEFLAKYNISDRETDVFLLLANGITTTNEISQQLGLSPNTISNHLNSLLSKTETRNKSELLSKILRLHAVKLEESKLLCRKPRALVIDDDPESCLPIQQNLALRGFQVNTLQHLTNLSRTLCGLRVDIVLVASEQQASSGIEVINEIKSNYDNFPPLVLYTSKASGSLPVLAGVEVIRKPIDFNILAFLVLDAFIESPKIRNRFYRVKVSDLTAKLNDLDIFQVVNIGYGGFSVAVPRPHLLKDRNLRNGRRLAFKVQLSKTCEIKGEAEVCWVRKKDQFGLKSGMGLKFVNLTADEQLNLRDYVRSQKYVSLSAL